MVDENMHIILGHQPEVLIHDLIQAKSQMSKYIFSVPNSSDRLIFVKIRAKDGRYFSKNTGEKTGKTQVFVILSSFCDLVHFQSVVHVFTKRLNIALNVH